MVGRPVKPPPIGRRLMRRAVAGLMVLALAAGCAGDLQTPGEALRILGDSLPQAHVGEEYEATIRAAGGLRPFTFEVGSGRLPPGLRLENGVLRGVPRETGSFEFNLTVSDANLSRTFREYSLSVVERPPPKLTVTAPPTEVRGPTEIRVRVENAVRLRAVSVLIDWDPDLFELAENSIGTEGRGAALLWKGEHGSLQVDMAALGEAWNGERALFRFTLVPAEAAIPRTALAARFLDDRGESHYQGGGASGRPGQRDALEPGAGSGSDDQGDADDAGEEPRDREELDDEPRAPGDGDGEQGDTEDGDGERPDPDDADVEQRAADDADGDPHGEGADR